YSRPAGWRGGGTGGGCCSCPGSPGRRRRGRRWSATAPSSAASAANRRRSTRRPRSPATRPSSGDEVTPLRCRARSPGRGVLAGSALLAGVVISLSPPLLVSAPPDEDPPAVRRVLLRPGQLPAELERVRRGALRQLTRAEFDDLLARATAAAAVRDPP